MTLKEWNAVASVIPRNEPTWPIVAYIYCYFDPARLLKDVWDMAAHEFDITPNTVRKSIHDVCKKYGYKNLHDLMVEIFAKVSEEG